MKITYYNSAEYRKTTTEEVDAILGNADTDEMTDDLRKDLQDECCMPMCNFASKGGHWKAIPWKFVIEIDQQ